MLLGRAGRYRRPTYKEGAVLTALARYLRSHHVGLLALFIALGGTAYAATLPRNSVGTKQLKRGAVTSAKVRNGALKAADFAPNTLLRGPQGARGPTGPRGLPGSDGQFTGAAAGGDLAGTFPNPTLKAAPAAAVLQPPGEAESVADGLVIDLGHGASGKLTLESYDTAELHESVTNPERLTAPRAGIYLVSGAVNFASDADGSRFLGFGINGTACCGREFVPAVNGSNTLLATSAVVSLNAGEFVTLKAGMNGAGNALNVSQVNFAMQWLGYLN
jgi:hypothetical protein